MKSMMRVSCSTEKDGSELQRTILKDNPLRSGEFMFLLSLNEGSRESLSNTFKEALEILADESRTHMTLEIRRDDL